MKIILSDIERSELRIRHRLERDGRTRDRIKAVLLCDKGWSLHSISQALLLDEETIRRHISDYCKSQKLCIETGGSSSKLTPCQRAEITSHLEETTYSKVADICSYVQEKYGIQYTVSGMRSWLQHQGFSYKKPKAIPAKADFIKQEAFIKAYEKLITTTPEDEPILFVDGVHPTMATKVSYGWIKKGTNKPIAMTASRTRMNLMGALNLETMNVLIQEYEILDSDAMEDYFGCMRDKYPDAPHIHLILDRGPYNTSRQSQEAAKKYGIILQYLPPYSPNLNAIERLWKVMNEHARNNRFFGSVQEFRHAIMNFFHETWPIIASKMRDRINDNFQRLKTPI